MGETSPMRSGKLVLAGIIAATLGAGLSPGTSGAAGVAPVGRSIEAPGLTLVPVEFHAHSKRAISYYCYDRNLWWFYRPYGNGQEQYARCMPYFHYPPQAYGRGGPREIK
jgi:hypothetical protein